MNVVEARRREVEPGLRGQGAPAMEPNVQGPARVIDADSGLTVAIVAPFPGDLPAYRSALLHYPQSDMMRAEGVRNLARAFGYLARQPLYQRNHCRPCSAADEAPELHAVIVSAATALGEQLRSFLPEVAEQEAIARGLIREEWMMSPGGWWTSGVVNWWSPLPYHRDGNNVAKVWSAMPVVRRAMRGGHLHVPEYDLVFECRDGQVIYFDGHDLLHGVTPMRRPVEGGYRISAVYYTVSRVGRCLSAEEELAHGRLSRTASEDGGAKQRAAGLME